jgi:[acyl-carrier-protein] S-malonyltransferase
MNIVALFSGQGAQKVGMAKDFYESSTLAREMIEKADKILGFPLSQIMFEGSEDKLTRTSHCQPALYLHGLVCKALLEEKILNLKTIATAGLSLGEFTAHAAAGSFTFEEGLQIVAKRGAFMEKACKETQGSMAALIGGEEESIRELANVCDVDVANLNAPGQIVLSGSIAGIDAVIEKAKDFGVRRAIKLNVAGAYHSRLMQTAQDSLAIELANLSVKTPTIPVVCNFGASIVTEPTEIKSMLEKQVIGSVRWTESIQLLIAQGHRQFIEFGPGNVIAGLISKIDKNAQVISIEDIASLNSVVEILSTK